MLTGRQDAFADAAAEGRPVRLPEPRGVRARLGGELARVDVAVVRGRHRQGLQLRGESGTVVALVGDGALTGGMAWEALNNIAADEDCRWSIVVNDNGRSYTPTVGGLARAPVRAAHQPALRAGPRARPQAGQPGARVVGRAAYDLLHGIKTGSRTCIAPQGMFDDLGLKYVGPVDGHDEAAVERALRAGQAVRRARPGALPDPQGQRLLRGGAPRGGPLPRGRQDRRRDRRGDRRPRRGQAGPTCSPRRSSSSARSASGSSPSPPR